MHALTAVGMLTLVQGIICTSGNPALKTIKDAARANFTRQVLVARLLLFQLTRLQIAGSLRIHARKERHHIRFKLCEAQAGPLDVRASCPS